MRSRLLVGVLALASCGGEDGPASLLAIDEAGGGVASAEVPDALVGGASTSIVTITNPGGGATGVLDVAVAGAGFALDPDATTCDGATLAAKASCTIGVAFQPTELGDHQGTVVVSAQPGGSITVVLTAMAFASDVSIAPAEADLGDVEIGTAVDTPIELTNQSALPLAFSYTLTGPGYSVQSTTCLDILAGGTSCEIVARFAPTALDQAEGVLDVTEGALHHVATLTGYGARRITIVTAGTGTGTVTSPIGITCGSGGSACSGLARSADPIVLTAAPDAGSGLVGWSEASCGASTTCSVPQSTAAATVTATFGPAGDVAITGGPGPGVVPLETSVKTTWQLVNSSSSAVAIDLIEVTGGSAFSLFSTTCGATLPAMSSCQIVSSFFAMVVGETGGRVEATVAGALHVANIDAIGGWYVSVAINGSGRVTSNPAGIDCPSNCEALFSDVTLTAVPAAGFHLVRWDAPCGTSPVCEPPIGKGQPSMEVYFEPDP